MQTSRLADLNPGQSGIVTAVAGSGRLASRLMEMGLIPGVAITVVRKAPFGDPVQYRVRGSVISMRAVEAASVLVCRDDEFPKNGDVASEKRSLQMALAAG